jgi:uncharacterized protein YcbX
MNKENIPMNANLKKPLTERVGDWVCINCKNLNFSFRKACNRCQLNRQDYAKFLSTYQHQQQAQLNTQQMFLPNNGNAFCGMNNFGGVLPQQNAYPSGGGYMN